MPENAGREMCPAIVARAPGARRGKAFGRSAGYTITLTVTKALPAEVLVTAVVSGPASVTV